MMNYVRFSPLVFKDPTILKTYFGWQPFLEDPKVFKLIFVGLFGFYQKYAPVLS